MLKKRRKRTASTEKPSISTDLETLANSGLVEVQESSSSTSLETLLSKICLVGTADARLDKAPETLLNNTSSTSTDIKTDIALETLLDSIP